MGGEKGTTEGSLVCLVGVEGACRNITRQLLTNKEEEEGGREGGKEGRREGREDGGTYLESGR